MSERWAPAATFVREPPDACSENHVLRDVSKQLSCVALVILGLGVLHPARGDVDSPSRPLFDGTSRQYASGIEIGAIVQTGHSEFASNSTGLSPDAQGLVLRDRNGLSARMVIGLVVAVASALAQASPKSVERKTWQSGGYIYEETTTTYRSEAEKAEMSAAAASTIGSLFTMPYSDMELHIYSRDRFSRGDSSGYKVNFYAGTGEKIALEAGFGLGSVSSVVDHAGVPTHVEWKYFGIPIRVSTVVGPLRLALAYEWNLAKYGVTSADREIHADAMGNPIVSTTSHPWHLDASTVLLHRIALSGGITTQQIQKPSLGYVVTAGVLF